MAQTLINIRIDEDIKLQMENLCKELGLTISSAFNIFARKMIRENGIPFSVSLDPFYSTKNIKALKESIDQLESGNTITKTMQELQEMENE